MTILPVCTQLHDRSPQIERHGARYPTAKARGKYLASLAKLQSATEFKDPRLDFLKDYTVVLGVDDLIPFGAKE